MSHILRYIFVIAVAYDGRRLGAGKMTLKASLSSTRFLSEPYHPPHHHVHAADRGAGVNLESARRLGYERGRQLRRPYLRLSSFQGDQKIRQRLLPRK
jgi:hypothetical protein